MSDVEKEVVELERKYWQAMVDKDLETVLAMTADRSIVTGSQGVAVIDHAQYRQLFETGNWEIIEFELEGVQTQVVADDVVLTAYNVTENMVVDGKPLTLKAADASTWVRQNGRWVCALHTESILGDPFGRDRKPADLKPAARRKPAARKKTVAARRRKVRG